MATVIKTPGVYIEEVSTLPASVAQVETAIPAFIGYTANAVTDPVRIRSMVEFIETFGGPPKTIEIDVTGSDSSIVLNSITVHPLAHNLYYCMQMYFANGGGPCYVISIGVYGANPASITSSTPFVNAINNKLNREDEPTLIVFPEAAQLADYTVAITALAQCAELQDRFTIIDLKDDSSNLTTDVTNFRSGIGTSNLKYGAAYHPRLNTNLSYPDNAVYFSDTGTGPIDGLSLEEVIAASLDPNDVNSEDFADALNVVLKPIRDEVSQKIISLPPSSSVAGIYASVDAARGVWKAPANVSVNNVSSLTKKINDADQADLNVHSTGKSVNVIRTFTGKGTLVWGARTLDGNSNEWRYVPVRRLYITAEESIKKATEFVVFEPNDKNTWTRVRGMIQNYLTGLWRQGALAGAKPEDAFFVKVGLGETMTSLDILEGRLIIEIGMAAVRPAEFIILRFSHKLQES